MAKINGDVAEFRIGTEVVQIPPVGLGNQHRDGLAVQCPHCKRPYAMLLAELRRLAGQVRQCPSCLKPSKFPAPPYVRTSRT